MFNTRPARIWMLGEEGFFGQIAEGAAGELDLDLELDWGPGTG